MIRLAGEKARASPHLDQLIGFQHELTPHVKFDVIYNGSMKLRYKADYTMPDGSLDVTVTSRIV